MNRIKIISQALGNEGISCLAINPGSTLFYLTGLKFHLMERPVIFFLTSKGKTALIHPAFETSKLLGSSVPIESFPYNDYSQSLDAAFRRAATMLTPLDCLGLEAQTLRLFEYQHLITSIKPKRTVDISSIISKSRMNKDFNEINAIRKAVNVAQRALLGTIPMIKPGISEKSIAAELTIQLLRHGSENPLPFDPIVASGPNGAQPHAVPGERLTTRNDFLVIDWGARVDGYCSDLTRTFAVGEIDPRLEKAYQSVFCANKISTESVKPSIDASSVDQIARLSIENDGFGEFFTHRTGHGLGIDAHEAPYIQDQSKQKLSAGMVFTIEPGVYIPGLGGVRIEDNILVTETGYECLTDFPRHLQILS